VNENSLLRIDPKRGRVVAEAAAGVEPGPMAATKSSLWVVSRGDQVVSTRGPDGRATEAVGLPHPYAVAAGPGAGVWVSERKPVVAWIQRIASGSGSSAVGPKTVPIPVPGPAAGAVAVGGGYLWVTPGPIATGAAAARVSLISTAKHRLVSSIRLGGETTAIAFGFGSAWIGTYDSRSGSSWVSVVRPGSGAPRAIRVGSGDGWGPLAIAVGGGSVWAITSAGTLVQIDPDLQRVVNQFPLADDEPEYLAVTSGAVWIGNGSDFSVSELNPTTGRPIRRIRLGSYARVLCGIAATRDAIWVAVGDSWCDPTHR